MNYYNETILKIKKHIKNRKWNQAHKLIGEELSMPYIPQKYENEFIKLEQEVNSNLLLNSQTSKINFDKFTIFEIIQSINNPLIPQALDQLSELNLRDCIKEIKQIFKNNNVKNSIKVVIFEYLVNQNINESMEVKTQFSSRTLSTDQSLIMTNDYNQLASKIEDILNDDPSLLEISNFYINQFIINLFPEKYAYEKDDELIFINIAEIAIGQGSKKIDSQKYLIINKILKRYI